MMPAKVVVLGMVVLVAVAGQNRAGGGAALFGRPAWSPARPSWPRSLSRSLCTALGIIICMNVRESFSRTKPGTMKSLVGLYVGRRPKQLWHLLFMVPGREPCIHTTSLTVNNVTPLFPPMAAAFGSRTLVSASRTR